MWYDKYPGTPQRGSALETILKLVAVQRRQSELLAVRVTVLNTMAIIGKDRESIGAALEGFKKYVDAEFPFLEKATNSVQDQQKAALEALIKTKIQINTGEMRKEKAAEARAKGMAKFKIKRGHTPGTRMG